MLFVICLLVGCQSTYQTSVTGTVQDLKFEFSLEEDTPDPDDWTDCSVVTIGGIRFLMQTIDAVALNYYQVFLLPDARYEVKLRIDLNLMCWQMDTIHFENPKTRRYPWQHTNLQLGPRIRGPTHLSSCIIPSYE